MFSSNSEARYSRLLLEEVKAHKWEWLPDTAYFGGGTPSLMPADLLLDLLDAIPRRKLTEITLECAPGTVTEGRAEAWVECGINRVSLGVQSFITTELQRVGRRHNAETVGSDVDTLRRLGIHNINIDLIAGLPTQTAKSWDRSLDFIKRLAPPHVSVYTFEIDEASRLGREVLLGGVRYGARELPDDDLTSDLYERAVDRLACLGLRRYEISNFALPGWESRHNLKYWRIQPYIGFGLDAHSFDGQRRWNNPDTLLSYFKERESNAFNRRDLVPCDTAQERFFIGLRLMDGIEPTPGEWRRFAQPIERWLQAGMLEQHGNRLRLANGAVLLSNEIFQDFIDAT